MDFSLTTLFVATSGTLATTGSTQDLTPAQIGLFGPDYAIVNAGSIASVPYFYIAQGRIEQVPGLGSKRSDKIAASKLIDWYKTTAETTAANEVWQVSGWNIQCDEDFTVTVVAHSSYIDTVAYNGLTRSVTVKGPCCQCGGSPCANASASDIQTLVDEFVTLINSTSPNGTDGSAQLLLATYFSAFRTGSGASSVLNISSKPITKYGQPCDVAADPFEYDRIWFRVFPYVGPATTQDFIVADSCNIPGAATVTQRSSYAKGTSDEIAQLEKNWYSYQTSQFKHLFRMNGYNEAFSSYVTSGTFYDLYYLKFKEYDQQETWAGYVPEDFTAIIAFPTGTGTTFETALVAALGAVKDSSGTGATTTTTTSTTSTSTTSTTTLIP